MALRCVEELTAKISIMKEVVKESESILDMEGSFQSTKICQESGNYFDSRGIVKIYSEEGVN